MPSAPIPTIISTILGRSARELCHRLEVLGVVERIHAGDPAALVNGSGVVAARR
jgi:hypothetical protein